MVEGIVVAFPRLQGTGWRVSSKPDDDYNCIAWAANLTTHWWWPVGSGNTYWPEGVPRTVTIEAFRTAFATLGYVECVGDDLEPGFQKIALFANDHGVPRHAARHLDSGKWTSKLGKMEDVEHALHDLNGTLYGSVVLVMKRPLPGTAIKAAAGT